jgi:hypothetical protein
VEGAERMPNRDFLFPGHMNSAREISNSGGNRNGEIGSGVIKQGHVGSVGSEYVPRDVSVSALSGDAASSAPIDESMPCSSEGDNDPNLIDSQGGFH